MKNKKNKKAIDTHRIASFEWTIFILFGFMIFFSYNSHIVFAGTPHFIVEIFKYLHNFGSIAVTFGFIVYGYYLYMGKVSFTYKRLFKLIFRYTYILIFISIIQGIIYEEFFFNSVLSIFTRQNGGLFGNIAFNIWWVPYGLFIANLLYLMVQDNLSNVSFKKYLAVIIVLLAIQYPGYQILLAIASFNPTINVSAIYPRFIISNSGESFIQAFTLVLTGAFISKYHDKFINSNVLKYSTFTFIFVFVSITSFVTWGQSLYIDSVPKIFRILGDLETNSSIANILISVCLMLILLNINIKKHVSIYWIKLVTAIFFLHPICWIFVNNSFHSPDAFGSILAWIIITWVVAFIIYNFDKGQRKVSNKISADAKENHKRHKKEEKLEKKKTT